MFTNITRRYFLIPFIILVLIIISLGCYAPLGNSPVITVVVTQVVNPVVNPVVNQAQNSPSQIPASAEPPLQPTVTLTIGHLTKPDTYNGSGPYVWDSDSSITASQNRPQGGEYFDRNMYERPFNANTQDTYFTQIDITKSSMLAGSPWIYGSIVLKGVSSTTNSLDATYALELDLNRDGRGDYLIMVTKPTATDWNTDGVQVWHDTNLDVGDNTPIKSDPPQAGNSYDQLVFDQGKAADPDLAWARVSPNKTNEVWFAFKSSMIQNSTQFLWNAWAQNHGMHPEWLDYNDHFTHDQAGSPLPGISQYPLKELAEVDNTCRWAVGFTPDGNEPGLCPVAASPTPVPPTVTSVPTFHMLIPAYPIKTKTPTPYELY